MVGNQGVEPRLSVHQTDVLTVTPIAIGNLGIEPRLPVDKTGALTVTPIASTQPQIRTACCRLVRTVPCPHGFANRVLYFSGGAG